MVLYCVLEVASLEEKISHRDKSKDILRVQRDAFLEVLSRSFEVPFLKV